MDESPISLPSLKKQSQSMNDQHNFAKFKITEEKVMDFPRFCEIMGISELKEASGADKQLRVAVTGMRGSSYK